VLGALVAGTTLFGPFGAVLAVPVTAVAINVAAEWRAHDRENAENAENTENAENATPPSAPDA
jgi:predicted PurR-regulated permease PerM